MNSVNLSNALFHSTTGKESSFLSTLSAFRNQRLTAKNMQNLRKFTKQVIANYELYNEGKQDILNQYGTDAVDGEGKTTGKEIKFDNVEGMKAYTDLLNLTNKVEVDIINLNEEPQITMSEIEYESIIFLFEEQEADKQ